VAGDRQRVRSIALTTPARPTRRRASPPRSSDIGDPGDSVDANPHQPRLRRAALIAGALEVDDERQ
jgi:hypothetical protein